jgi:hypothetical protein
VSQRSDLVAFEEEPERTPEQIAAEVAAAAAEMARLRTEAAEIVAGGTDGPSTDLVPTQQSPGRVKSQLASTRSKLVHKQAEIKKASKELEALMREQMDLLSDTLEPMQALVKRIEEAIWTVNLYLGRDEQIVVLRKGEPCPADEPISVRQMVLAMDQESALFPEQEGIGHEDVTAFDKWLMEDERHLDQVAPERKGVVALVPRFTGRDDRRRSKEDEQTYFLIRNGENVYRIWTEFNVEDRLVPTSDEFTDCFQKKEWSWDHKRNMTIPVTPGTRAWEQAEQAASEKQRHYMRVALILQGLVDRTTVFHPLPEAGLSFLDREDHTRGKVRFITDMEHALTTGRESFQDWQKRLNAQLRVGMRIIGSFDYSHGWRRYSSEYDEGNSRVTPRGAEYPASFELHPIEEKQGKAFIIRYKRHERIYSRYSSHEAKRRASCKIFAKDEFILPFDLVTADEMRAYLAARLDRHNYVEMFPLLKAAIKAKDAEAKEERPFREMLTGVLVRDSGVSMDDAAEAVGPLVEWWKLTNRHHRPLIGGEDDQAKAVRMIVAEHARRLTDAARGVNEDVVAKLIAAHPHALAIGRRRDGKYAVITPQREDPDVFVTIQDYSARGKPYEPMEWRLLTKTTLVALTIVHHGERLDSWNLGLSFQDHMTGPEIDEIAERFIRNAGDDKLVALVFDPKRKRFYGFEYGSDAVVDTKHPLTGRDKPPEMREFEITWRRTTGQKIKTTMSGYSHRDNWTSNIKPWQPDPDATYSKGVVYRQLYHDPKLDARMTAQQARYDANQEINRQLHARAWGAKASIEAAWLEREEAREYAKFLEDFADPELWEGHKKLLTIRYPHSHVSFGTFSRKDTFYAMLEMLVEHGIEFDGLTVAEAFALAQTHKFMIAPKGEVKQVPVEDDDEDADDEAEGPIPADILDLRFKLPEPEDDTDEDDDDTLQ